MKNLDFGRYTLSINVLIAMLAGCGGSQSAFSPVTGMQRASKASSANGGAATYAVLFSFDETDGKYPFARLLNVNGTLYGTTWKGGTVAGAQGTVFSLTGSGTETVLHTFVVDTGDGERPEANLLNVNGTLYGTTYGGGTEGHGGTVFSITRSGVESVLYSFEVGSHPSAGLRTVDRMLYGTTYGGGEHRAGTVFSVTMAGKHKLLHSFAGSPDGAAPVAGLLNVNGTLYGTTYGGGAKAGGNGTVFTLTTAGKERVLYSFAGRHDGANPSAGLLNLNGTSLYGTTYHGGAHGLGTVFSLTTAGKERVLYSFAGSPDGANPEAGLRNVNGTLYGTTYQGGAHGLGTVFSVTTAGKERVLHSFAGRPDGASPVADLINVSSTLYGTTYKGGRKDLGTIFALTP
jgi:uncharacterized repeat protein (TIGR03803 family)